MKRRRLRSISLIMIFSMFLGGCVGGTYFKDSIRRIKIQNYQIINETNRLLYTKEGRSIGIEKLTTLLDNGKYLDFADKAKIQSQLAKMHFVNSDYEEGLAYSINAIYIVDKLGDHAKKAKILIDISNVFMELGEFESAENILNHVLSLQIKDMKQSHEIKSCSYMTLADIYSRTKKSDKAIAYVLKSMSYSDQNESYYAEECLMKGITIARALFYKGHIKESKAIITQMESEIEAYSDTLPANIIIDYLGMKAKIEIHEGNIEEGLKIAENIFNWCEREGLIELEKVHMQYIVDALHIHDDEENVGTIRKYEHRLLEIYKELINSKNKEFVFFIIDSYKNRIEYLEIIDSKIKFYLTISFFSLVIIIIIAWLSSKLRAIKKQGDLDALTGAYNRGKFNIEYNKCLDKGKKTGLIIIDVDYFKQINDTYGHSFGDVVLRNMASLIKNRLPKGDHLFRYGGEEFCVLCKNKPLEEIVKLAESLREEVSHMVWREGIQVTISLGIAHTDQGVDLFKVADENLYESKKAGRNKVTY